MRQFDLYEFIGYIVPGIILLVGIAYLLVGSEKIASLLSVSVSEFGIVIVLAYATGQLLQTLGNVLEKLWWKLPGGMPTDWIRSGKHDLLTQSQIVRIEQKIAQMHKDDSFKIADSTSKQWFSITREIYAAVSHAGHNIRIDTFNGHYGLCRGMATGIIMLLVMGLVIQPINWLMIAVMGILFMLSIYRMHQFGVYYGRELFVQFLNL